MPLLFIPNSISVTYILQLIQMILCTVFSAGIIVRNMGSANPQSDSNRILSKRIRRIFVLFLKTILPYILTGTNQSRSSCKLLRSQKSERITHHDGSTAWLVGIGKFSVEDGKRGKAKIRFRFTATSRKPYQIYYASFWAVFLIHGFQIHQNKCKGS